MKLFGQLGLKMRTWYVLTGVLVLSSLVLTACDADVSMGGNSLPSGNGGKGCTKVGILLPEVASSDRWEQKDHPFLVKAIQAAIPGVHIDYNNANGNTEIQESQADADLANGDCILVVAAHDSIAAKSIVEKAKARQIPVIAYDRLIQSKNLDYYVSFNNIEVGRLQGQYIADHYWDYQKTSGKINIAVISGSQTDTNALLFSIGVHKALDPLFANNDLSKVSEDFTPDWSNSGAQTEMTAILADVNNDLQIAYVANDGMANSVIEALKSAKLDGKVLVTGQDATDSGIRNIIAGKQSMTVYKPVEKEAQSVGDLVKALYNGTNVQSLTQGARTVTYDNGSIPSILDAPIGVDIHNIATTVIKDKYISKDVVCKGMSPGAAGIC